MKRYPFGLPAWAYWVVVVLLVSVMSQIPGFGTVIALVGLGVAFFWFFVKVPKERDRRFRAYCPVPVVGQVDLQLDRLEVVGESHYVVEIAHAVALAGRSLTAVISWEPRNPHSQSGKTLRVDLVAGGQRLTCGYIPDAFAARLQPAVKANAERGLESTLPATVFGGTALKPNYGVILGSGVSASGRPRFD